MTIDLNSLLAPLIREYLHLIRFEKSSLTSNLGETHILSMVDEIIMTRGESIAFNAWVTFPRSQRGTRTRHSTFVNFSAAKK